MSDKLQTVSAREFQRNFKLYRPVECIVKGKDWAMFWLSDKSSCQTNKVSDKSSCQTKVSDKANKLAKLKQDLDVRSKPKVLDNKPVDEWHNCSKCKARYYGSSKRCTKCGV